MASIGELTVKVTVVGTGKSRLGALILGMVARIFKIDLRIESNILAQSIKP